LNHTIAHLANPAWHVKNHSALFFFNLSETNPVSVMNQLNRRSFIRTTLVTGSGLVLSPLAAWGQDSKAAGSMMGVHPFVQDNPDAVFIIQTDLDVKTNSAAIREKGLSFGRSVFGLTDDPAYGVPLSHRYVIKPNLTCRFRWHENYSIEGSMGIVTDAHFTEGIIESLKELSIAASQVHMREVNCPEDLEDGGYLDMAARTDADLQCIETPYDQLDPEYCQVKDPCHGHDALCQEPAGMHCEELPGTLQGLGRSSECGQPGRPDRCIQPH
jgi:hypothetical protein